MYKQIKEQYLSQVAYVLADASLTRLSTYILCYHLILEILYDLLQDTAVNNQQLIKKIIQPEPIKMVINNEPLTDFSKMA